MAEARQHVERDLTPERLQRPSCLGDDWEFTGPTAWCMSASSPACAPTAVTPAAPSRWLTRHRAEPSFMVADGLARRYAP